MRVLGLIPARGGSKGIPGKNLAPLAGRPLIGWTIDAAAAATSLTRTIVTTDDDGIAAACRALGADVPFRRPDHLAGDLVAMMPVVLHALDHCAAAGEEYDAVCLLQPTAPFRTPDDIDGAIALLHRTAADAVISFVAVEDAHPARMRFVDADGRVGESPYPEGAEGRRRQDLPPLYLRNGAIYLTRTSVLRTTGTFAGDDCRAWIMPRERSVNIDEPMDLRIAEAVAAYTRTVS